MKKSTYLLALVIVFLFQKSNAQTTRTFFERDILYGKVKQVNEMQYMPKYRLEPAMRDTEFFDEYGNTLAIHSKPRFEPLYSNKFVLSHDTLGKHLEIISSREGEKINAIFDASGVMTECDRYFGNRKVTLKSFYQYDKNGNVIKYNFFEDKGNSKLKRFSKYNTDNMVTEEHDFYGDGQNEYYLIYHYESFDKNGNWTKRTSQKKQPSGEMTDVLTTEQEIIYY